MTREQVNMLRPVLWVVLALLTSGISGCGYVRLAANEMSAALRGGQERKAVNIDGDTEVISSLDDPRFDQHLAEQGLYEPEKFREQVGSSLFTLEGDLSKTPVVFVHGIKGHPGDWSYVVERLDRERFHPWFFYYPTGERLDLTAEAFYHALENLSDYEKIYIVAHSMGGLLPRRPSTGAGMVVIVDTSGFLSRSILDTEALTRRQLQSGISRWSCQAGGI